MEKYLTKKNIVITVIILLVIVAVIFVWKEINLIKKTCFKLTKVKIKKLGLNNSIISVDAFIKNKSNTDMTVWNQEYDVYVGGKKVTHISKKEKVPLKAHDSNTASLDVEFDPLNVLNISIAELGNLLSKDSDVKIRIKGKMMVRTKWFSMPYKIDDEESLKDLISGVSEPC